MAFDTTFEPVSFNLTADPGIIIGTCMLTTLDDFGQVMSANLTRVADTREIKDCRNRLRAFLIENAGFELDFECLFDASVAAPEMGSALVFPLVGVTGIVLPGASIKWSHNGERMISIKAKSWDHLAAGSTSLFTYDTGTGAFEAPV